MYIYPMHTLIFKKAVALKFLNAGSPGICDQHSGPGSQSLMWCCVDVNRGQDLG